MKKYLYPLLLALISIGMEHRMSYGNEYQSLAYSIMFFLGIMLSAIIAVIGAVIYVKGRKGSFFLFWYAGFLGIGNLIGMVVMKAFNV
jgi:hypothetical protein